MIAVQLLELTENGGDKQLMFGVGFITLKDGGAGGFLLRIFSVMNRSQSSQSVQTLSEQLVESVIVVYEALQTRESSYYSSWLFE